MTYARLFIAALIVLHLAAQTKPNRSVARKTFLSPDRAFRLKYPRFLVSCKEGRSLEGSEDSCSAYLQTCDDDAIVCMAYPASEYRGATTFGAATFSVTVLQDLTSESKCLNEVDPHSCGPPQGYEVHNGVKFKTGHCSDGGAGHSADHQIYRTFHGAKCYQFSTVITVTNALYPDTATEFTSADWNKVERLLQIPLNTFRFRK
jgi:hypothetical protein